MIIKKGRFILSAFWYNFFSNPWISGGLLLFLPVLILVGLMLVAIVLVQAGDHGKWLKELAATESSQQYRALKKAEPPVMSSRGWLCFWLVFFIAAFLLVGGAVFGQRRDRVYANYVKMDRNYVTKKSLKIKNYVLLKQDNVTTTDQIKKQVKDVNQADQILLRLDNGQTITMPGPQEGNDLRHGKTVTYKQRLANNRKEHEKLSMQLTVATPKAKYRNYHGFKTSYHLVVTQNFN